MGDLRRAIDFGDVTLQIEALLKLHQDIVGSMPKCNVDKITAKNFNNFSQMQLLSDCICSSETLVAECACKIIFKFVKENRMDAEYAINYLINLFSSAKSSCYAILSTIFEIMSAAESKLQYPSKLNPIILIYNRKPDVLPTILSQIETFFLKSDGENMFHWVKPFLTRLCLSQTNYVHFLITIDWILSALSGKKSLVLIDFIWQSINWIDLKNDLILSKCVKCQPLINSHSHSHCHRLILFLLENSKDSSFFQEILAFGKNFVCHSFTYLFFARFFWKLPCSDWNLSIFYLESFLSTCKCPILVAQMLPGTLSVYSSMQQAAKIDYKFDESLKRIRICIGNMEKLFENDLEHDHDVCYAENESVFSQFSAEYQFLTILCQQKDDEGNIHYDAQGADEFHVNYLTSILMTKKSSSASILPLLCRIVTTKPSLSMYVMYVVLHHFSKQMTYDVAKYLPELANNLFNVNFLRFRILRDLYKKHPTILFEQVKPFVVDVCSTKDRLLALEKARLVSIVCQFGDVDCGVEMLGLLEKIVAERKSPDDADLMIVAVDAIAHLCWNEVLDVNVAWKMLFGKLQKDDRLIVVESLMEFSKIVAKIYRENEEDVKKNILTSVVEFLWKNVVSTNFQRKALESLSEFDPILFETKFLPNNQSADGIELSDDTNFVKLLDFVNRESYEGLSKFLTNVITREVESIGRHVYNNAVGSLSAKKSSFEDLPTIFYEKFLENSTSNDMKADLSIPVLLTFEINIDDSSTTLDDSTKKSLMTRGRQYVQVFKRLLVQTPVDADDWRRALTLPFAWKRFMSVLFDGCVRARRADLQTTTGKKVDHQKRMNSVWLHVRDQIVELIKTACKESIAGRSNACLALMGLALAVKTFSFENKISVDDNFDPHLSPDRWLSTVFESLLTLACDRQEFKPRHKTFFDDFEDKHSVLVSCLAFLSVSYLLGQISDEFSSQSIDFEKLVSDLIKNRLTSAEGLHFLQGFYLPIAYGFLQKADAHADDLQRAVDILLRCTSIGRWFGVLFCLNRLKNDRFYESIVSSSIDQAESLKSDSIEYNVAAFSLSISISIGIVRFGTPIFVNNFVDRALKLIDRGSSSCFLPKSIILRSISCHDGEDFQQNKSIFDQFVNELNDKNILSIRKGDVLSALSAACGSELGFFAAEDDISMESGSDLDKFQRNTIQILINSTKISISIDDQSPLYDSLITKPLLISVSKLIYSSNLIKNKLELPKNYSYLNEKSTLRRCVDILIDKNADPAQKSCVVNAVANCKQKSLTPVDWCSIIWPLRDKINEKSSISIAIDQKSIGLLTKFVQKPIFDQLNNESKTILAENIGILIKILNNKRQILDLFGNASNDPNVSRIFYENLTKLMDLDEKSMIVRQDFYVFKLIDQKIDRYSTFIDIITLILCSVISKIDDNRFVNLLERVDSLTKFVYLTSKLINCSSHQSIFNQILELYVDKLNLVEKHSACCIFAHIFHSNEISSELKQNLILQILNSSLICLNSKSFQKFDGYFELLTSLMNSLSSTNPPLPYFLADKSKETADPDVDMLVLMRRRLPYATRDCLIVQEENFLLSKFLDWCVRVVTFEVVKDDILLSRPFVIDCLRIFRNESRFKEILTKSDIIDYLF